MFNTMKSKEPVIKRDIAIHTIAKDLSRVVGENNIEYLLQYKEYHQHIKQLDTLNKVLGANKVSSIRGNIICLESEPKNESHAYFRTSKSLLQILNQYAESPLDDMYTIKMDTFLNGQDKKDYIYGKKRKSIIEEVSDSFIIVQNAGKYIQDGSEEARGCLSLLNDMVAKGTVIFKGDKEELQMILKRLGNPSHFYFNTDTSYSFEEFTHTTKVLLKKRSILVDDKWDNTLRAYLNQPSESKKKRDHKYLKNFLDNMQKIVFSDPTAEINGEFRVLKSEYLNVPTSKSTFKELKSLEKLNNLIGMEEAKKSVSELIAYLEFNQKLQEKIGKAYPLNLHMMFTGTPGTGKTTIARIIASILHELGYIEKAEVVEVDKKDLVSQFVGHTSIKTNEIIQQARGGVLFIDEAYAVADDKFGKDAIATLIKAMEDMKTELVVIVAGYKKEMNEFINSNPGMASRIGRKIHFEDYAAEELIQMYDKKLEEYSMLSTPEIREELLTVLDHYRNIENFGNGRFVDNLIQDILFTYAVNTEGIPLEDMDFTLTADDIPQKYYDQLEV